MERGYVAPGMNSSDLPSGRARLDLLDPLEVSQLGGLELITEGVVEGFLSGLHASPFHGFSVEFSEHRRYTQGDDPKGIDWLVYAKTDRYYVKQYEADTNANFSVLLDTSKSMAFTAVKSAKRFVSPRAWTRISSDGGMDRF